MLWAKRLKDEHKSLLEEVGELKAECRKLRLELGRGNGEARAADLHEISEPPKAVAKAMSQEMLDLESSLQAVHNAETEGVKAFIARISNVHQQFRLASSLESSSQGFTWDNLRATMQKDMAVAERRRHLRRVL